MFQIKSDVNSSGNYIAVKLKKHSWIAQRNENLSQRK